MPMLIFRSGGRTTWAVPADAGELEQFHSPTTGWPGPRPLVEAVELFDRAASAEERWNGQGAALPSSSRVLTGAAKAAAREHVLAGLREGYVPALV